MTGLLDEIEQEVHKLFDKDYPGEVEITFLDRYSRGVVDLQYKVEYDGQVKEGSTTASDFKVTIQPSSLNDIIIWVKPKNKTAYKNLDPVRAFAGQPHQITKLMKQFTIPGSSQPHPPDQIPPAQKPPNPSPGSNQVTAEQLRGLFPRAKLELRQQIADEVNAHAADYKLDSTYRLAFFFGQVMAETGQILPPPMESLKYTPEGYIHHKTKKLVKGLTQFSYFRHHLDEAWQYGWTKPTGLVNQDKRTVTPHDANEVEIANRAYDDANQDIKHKLGNTQPGDGSKFRGRGMKQLTGRGNYTEFTKWYKTKWPDGAPDFTQTPEMIDKMPYFLRSGVYFWLDKQLYDIADKASLDASGNINPVTIDQVSQKVNGGDTGLLLRRQHTNTAYHAFIALPTS